MSDQLTSTPVKKVMLRMIAPASFGMLMTFMFQLVDTYFIGKLGTLELASISFAYPVYLLIVSLFMGISAGISSSIGKALGESNLLKAKLISGISILFFSFATLLIGIIGYKTIIPLFTLLGANADTLPHIAAYMQIIYLGMFALVGTLIGNAALMAKGIMLKSTLIMAIGGVINLVLDYLLIFGAGPIPAMELEGAALATVISWISTCILMTILLVKEKLIRIHFPKGTINTLKEVIYISLPAVAAQVLNPIAIAVITRLSSAYGDAAVAAYGIATRIESLGLTAILSLSVILTPIVAQNFGAKIQQRLDQIIVYSGKLTVYWGIALFLLLFFLAEPLAGIFTSDELIIKHITFYFRIVGISFPSFGLALITTSFFNGVYQPKASLQITLLRSLGLTIPLAIIGSLVDSTGIWIGIAIANILSAIYADKRLKKWLLSKHSELIHENRIQSYWKDMKYIIGRIKGKAR